MSTLREDVFTFMATTRGIFRRMRNVLDKSCGENRNIFYVRQFFPANRPVYEIMSKNVVDTQRPQMTIWCMRVVLDK